jgi:uncharacterized protein
VVIHAEAPIATTSPDGLSITTVNRKITAIPDFSWANRGEGQMQVCVPGKISNIKLEAN